MKNIKWLVPLIVLTVFSASMAMATSQWDGNLTEIERYAQEKRQYDEKNDNEVVAIVNDLEIIQLELENEMAWQRALKRASGNPIDEDEIRRDSLDLLINEKVALSEAARQNIKVTDEEIKESVEIQKKITSETDEGQQQLQAYLKGYGITEEEYWDKVIPKSLRKEMHLYKLRNQLFPLSEYDNPFIQQEAWDKYIKDLREKADIRIM